MRRQISLLVIATTSTMVVSFVIPLCLLVSTLAEDRAMAAADQEARNVAILVAGLSEDQQLGELVTAVDVRGTPRTGVLTATGRRVGTGAPSRGDPEVRRARRGEAFTVVDEAGGRVVIPVFVRDGTAVVRSSVTEDDLRAGVTRAWLGIIGLGALLLALALAIAWRLGRRISEPLLEVAGTAHRLREGDLSARAEIRGPEETEELARALNGLAERTGELLETERAAVGDLSHRLRTPVTALRLDAESVTDPLVAERLQSHIGVLQRSIDSIVKEARRPVRSNLPAESDAGTVVRRRVDFWEVLAEDQGRAMRTEIHPGPLSVPLTAEDLADLVDVLVDNVFAHTPEGVPMRVSLERSGDEAVLSVADAGPGLAVPTGPEDGADRPGHTGLGLDIARRTARGCGGRLRVDRAPEGGTLVEVRLPART